RFSRDWSSDVCSSDLSPVGKGDGAGQVRKDQVQSPGGGHQALQAEEQDRQQAKGITNLGRPVAGHRRRLTPPLPSFPPAPPAESSEERRVGEARSSRR